MSETLAIEESQIAPHRQALANLANSYPQIEQLASQDVSDTMDVLVAEFGIKDDFFEGQDGPAHTLLLASVASNLSALEHAGKTPQNNYDEFSAIADATAYIALDYISGFQELVRDSTQETGGYLSEAGQEAVLKKYKSSELTQAVEAKIKDGMLAGVKQRLGITDENEDPYELLVLSIAWQNDRIHDGININTGIVYPTPDEWSEDFEAAKAKGDEALLTTEHNNDWRQGLLERRKKFLSEIPAPAVNPDAPAFVSHLNGKKYLCITADVAEVIAYDETSEQRAAGFDDDDYDHLLSLIEHEYTHTQGGLFIDDRLGISLEELRAEWFSGMKNGYEDVKMFFQDIRLITGLALTDVFQKRTKGGNPEAVYGDIASHLGLENLYKVVTALPSTYLEVQSSTLVQGLQGYLGGYEGVAQRLLDIAQENDQMPAVNQRVEEQIQRVHSISGSYTPVWLQKRRNHSQMVTQMLSEAEQKLFH